jgi:ATP-binding cassette, subfamily B, bacterial
VLCVRFGVYFPECDLKLQLGRHAWESLRDAERMALTDRPTAEAGHPPVAAAARDISLRGVSFRYGDCGPLVLDRVNLTVPVGSSTAIVGLNGAGKSTLVKILGGLYQPTEGHIYADDTPLREADLDGWRRGLAVTFQDFIRYGLSARENVAMSAITRLEDEAGIVAVLDRVGLREVISGLPYGLDTPLSRQVPGGTDLSGGQWQRLALARALFAVRHGAHLLVLDEPTAHLDARGEAEFYETFLSLTEGVTSVIISHRFSSVRRAGQILVLERGRVTERGTHTELVSAGNTYAHMFRAQASRFAATGAP